MNQPREVVADALPELPTNIWTITVHERVAFGNARSEKVYTADQMREYARTAIAATTPAASEGVEERARELLAAEYERGGMEGAAAALRRGDNGMDFTIAAALDAIAAALRTPAASVGDVGRVVGYANRNEFAAEGSAGFTCSKRPPLTDSSFFTIPLYTTTPPTQQDARAVDDTARLDWLSRSSNLQNEIVQHGYGSLRHRIDAALAAPRAGDTAQDSGQG